MRARRVRVAPRQRLGRRRHHRHHRRRPDCRSRPAHRPTPPPTAAAPCASGPTRRSTTSSHPVGATRARDDSRWARSTWSTTTRATKPTWTHMLAAMKSARWRSSREKFSPTSFKQGAHPRVPGYAASRRASPTRSPYSGGHIGFLHAAGPIRTRSTSSPTSPRTRSPPVVGPPAVPSDPTGRHDAGEKASRSTRRCW